MGTINNVVLRGRLAKDPELKKTASNKDFVRVTVACSRGKNKDGEDLGADFISAVAWGQPATYISTYGHKGDFINAKGHITTGSYDGQYGKVYTTDVTIETVSLESKDPRPQRATDEPREEYTPESFTADELPFY